MLRDAGDIVDRLCIAQLKAERIGTPQTKKEFKEFWEGLFPHMLINPQIEWWEIISNLYQVHRNIWELEADIRQAKMDKNVEEVGFRALQIRDYNRIRIELKNRLNQLTGEGFLEIKKDHGSE